MHSDLFSEFACTKEAGAQARKGALTYADYPLYQNGILSRN